MKHYFFKGTMLRECRFLASIVRNITGKAYALYTLYVRCSRQYRNMFNIQINYRLYASGIYHVIKTLIWKLRNWALNSIVLVNRFLICGAIKPRSARTVVIVTNSGRGYKWAKELSKPTVAKKPLLKWCNVSLLHFVLDNRCQWFYHIHNPTALFTGK
jgi:hypothetical protein